MYRLRVLLAEDDDHRCRVLIHVGGNDLALVVGDGIELLLEPIEHTLVASLHQEGHRVVRAGGDYLLGQRLDLLQDRLVPGQKTQLGLHGELRLGEARRAVLHLVDHLGDLGRQLLGVHLPQLQVVLLPGDLVHLTGGQVKRLDDRAQPDQQFLHALLFGGLVLHCLHVLQRELAGIDLLRKVLDMQRAELVECRQDIQKDVLRADQLHSCHWDQHTRPPPRFIGILEQLASVRTK